MSKIECWLKYFLIQLHNQYFYWFCTFDTSLFIGQLSCWIVIGLCSILYLRRSWSESGWSSSSDLVCDKSQSKYHIWDCYIRVLQICASDFPEFTSRSNRQERTSDSVNIYRFVDLFCVWIIYLTCRDWFSFSYFRFWCSFAQFEAWL